MSENKFNLQDLETQELLKMAEPLAGHSELGFSDMGELEGRQEFLKYMLEGHIGYKLPFATLEKDFLIAPHELTLLSGYTGTGKSELVNQILLDCICQGAKGVISSLELTTNQLKKRLYQQSTGTKKINQDWMNQFHNFYAGKLKYWNGTKMQTIDELLTIMTQFYLEDGCTVFVLDNMMMLGAGPSQYDKQYETVNMIKNFTKLYPVSVFLVAHPRKPKETTFVNLKYTKPYAFDVPSIYEISGSATIANLVDNYLALGTNTIKSQAKKDIEAGRLNHSDCREILEYGDVMLKREKRREHGSLFHKELYFDVNFRSYKDCATGKILPYLKLKNL